MGGVSCVRITLKAKKIRKNIDVIIHGFNITGLKRWTGEMLNKDSWH